MNKLTTILAIALIALTAACNVEDSASETEIIQIFELPDNYVHGRTLPADYPETWTDMADPNGDLSSAVCECTSEECQTSWVEDNFGCGVCVMVTCGNEVMGGCVSCDGQSTTWVEPLPLERRPTRDHQVDESI